MVKKKILSERDRQIIEKAIQNAERQTSGEIVTMITHQSDSYLSASLIISIIITFIVQLVVIYLYPLAYGSSIWVGIASFLIVFLFLELTEISVWFVPASHKRHIVQRFAREQFLQNNLHMTRDHAAVFVVISLTEHCVEIVADSGIDKNVAKGTWDNMAAALAFDLRQKSLGQAISNCVESCTAIMSEYYPAKDNDNNELSNSVIEHLQ